MGLFFSGEELAAFEVVVLQMLEDVQERLVYRAQVFTDFINLLSRLVSSYHISSQLVLVCLI